MHDDGDPTDWLDHFTDDNALLQQLQLTPPSQVAQLSNAAPGSQADPSVVGQWGPLQQWPVEFINAIMLPTGKVMGWDRLMNIRLWDPTTGQITIPNNPGYNIFCTGMSLLADGSVLVTGGHVDNLVGLPFSSIYNPFTDTWKQLPNINGGRWYPSSTTLANGDVLILSGATNMAGNDDPLPQVYDVTANKWIDLTTAEQSLPLYPRTFSAPNGDVFVAGSQQLSEYIDTTGTGALIPVANRIDPDRDYGSAVMYAPGKILYVGGGSPATNSAEIIDLNQPNPQWQEVSPMAFARRNCNATLLPDGEVLVTGGNTGSAQYDGDPVTAAEIWNPATETFTTLSSESDVRWYHSTALLLPDGRILSGSGDNHLTEQVYSPSYLFEGPRPTITSAPQTVEYGDNFFVGTPDASSITKVEWIRMGTATHAENWDQYAVDASFATVAGGLNVAAPYTPNSSPPGYYMLFILKGDVPSVAAIIRVGATLPSMSVANIAVTERAAGNTTNAVFTVNLELSSAKTVTVAYSTADGTAVAGKNYTAQSGVLTFNPGVTSQTVTVPVIGDGINDPNLTFSLNLSSPSEAALAQASAQCLIRDFNSLPVLQIQGVTMQEGNSGTTNANFVVTLSSPRTQAVTVAYTTVDGTATAGKDYISQNATLTFPAGATQETISVPVIGDTIDEPHNWFFVDLSSPVGATVDVGQAECYIYNDDNAPFVSIPTTATVTEPGVGGVTNLVLTATLSAASGRTVTVGWQTLANGTAVDGTNYSGQYGGLTFDPGVTSQTFTIPILNDNVKTPDLTFSIQLQASLINGTYGNMVTNVTITNSDALPSISLGNASVTEGNSGNKSMTFTVKLSAPTNQAVTVNYATSAGTATANTDYVQTTGVLTIPANATSATFTVPVKGDTTVESDETFNVTLSTPSGATIAVGKAVGAILDDDGAPVPATPTGLTASASFGAAVLSWQAVPGATSYSIYRGLSSNSEGTTPVITGVTGTTFTDSGLTNGKPYYYWITAVTKQGATNFESAASNEVVIAPTSLSFPYFFTHQSYALVGFPTSQSNLLSLNGWNIENVGFYGTYMQLTDGGTNQTDSFFTQNPVSVGRFTTNFTFEQIPTINYVGSDIGSGLTFTIQGDGPTALGADDSGLGYAGIGNSVAVKFDLTDDAGEGPDSTGLYTDGANPTSANSIDLRNTGIDLHSGHLFNVAMSYDGATLTVTLEDTVTQATATQSYAVNIPAIVGGGQAYVGFTAGTGEESAIQSISNWTFTPAPNAPSGLQATSPSGSQVNLTWTNNDPNATGTVIQRKAGAGGTYVTIGSTSTQAANSFTDTTAIPGTMYFYRVQATDSGSTSVFSNEASATTVSAHADLQVTVTDGQTSATPGSAVTYTIVVSNAGPDAVAGVNIVDSLSSGFDTTFGNVTFTATATGDASGFWASAYGTVNNTVTMPAGSTITYTVHATVLPGATGSIANTATVTGPTGETEINPGNNTATDTDTISGTPHADLQVTASDGQNSILPGSTVTYTIVVSNAGPATVAGANIVDNLPSTFSSITFSATATGGASGFWQNAFGNLNNTVTMPPGSTITYLLTGTLSSTATGSVSNTATVTDPAGVTENNPANNTATDTDTVGGTPTADLQVTVTDGQTTLAPGSTVTYTIVVSNAGPSTVTGANIVDNLPATFSNISFTATATGDASGFWQSAFGNLNNTVTMPPGSTITYLLTGTLSPTAIGTIANTATITGSAGVTELNPANNTATDTDTVAATPQADLQITMTDGQTTVSPGAAVTYTIVVTNAGPNTVTGANIVTTLSSGFDTTFGATTFTATATGDASGFWGSAFGNVNNTVTMPPGSTITYLLHASLLPGVTTGSVSGTASVTAPAGVNEINPANNTATDTDTVNGTPHADLQVTVTDGQTTATPGSAVTYTIVVTNAGPSTVVGANIVDNLPAVYSSPSFTATATGNASGFWQSAVGNLNNTVTMPPASTITYLLTGTLSGTATGSVANTATVTAPVGVVENNPANNTATDTDTVGNQPHALVAQATPAAAPTPMLNFPNGFVGTSSQLSLNGSSASIAGSNLQLTTGGKNQAASIFARTPVNVTNFSTRFALQFAGGTNPLGDGMTFTIQGTGMKALGSNGGNLGYGSIKKSIAVKFDLFSNAGEGANSTGLYTNGAAPTSAKSNNLNGSGIDLHSGHVFDVAMNYDGAKLTVTITDMVTQATATQSYTVNIPSLVGGKTAYVGFTAGTSANTAVQKVLNWTYAALPPAVVVTPTTSTATAGAAKTTVTTAGSTPQATSAVKLSSAVSNESAAATSTAKSKSSSTSSTNTAGTAELLQSLPKLG
ncbi:MAG TPA: Calx-beta domain-containing protein [Pirellulales bacterium]|nr:Calx-beta domain-containing protein [Pirellulales bacterium]